MMAQERNASVLKNTIEKLKKLKNTIEKLKNLESEEKSLLLEIDDLQKVADAKSTALESVVNALRDEVKALRALMYRSEPVVLEIEKLNKKAEAEASDLKNELNSLEIEKLNKRVGAEEAEVIELENELNLLRESRDEIKALETLLHDLEPNVNSFPNRLSSNQNEKSAKSPKKIN